MERIPASERTREKLKALMEGRSEVEDGHSDLVRLAVRLIIEEALEGEARDAVGRDYYGRGAMPGAGYRNGYRPGRVKSAEGAIEYSAPQVADRSEPFRSRIREIIGGRTEALEAMAVEMYARGLSVRDIEALFADEAGKSLLSRTAVSELTERLWAEYEAFASRDLSEFEIVYLFIDGIAERLHLGQPREAVLAAWGILADGKKALLHLAPGTKEDTASCKEFLQDLRRRGLPDPLLVASDGAPGIICAIEECLPRTSGSAAWCTRRGICRARYPRTSGLSSRPVPRPAIKRPRQRWHACCATTSWRPMAGICPRRSLACKTTSKPASRICAFRSAIARRSAQANRSKWTFKRRIEHICGKTTAEQTVISVGIAFPHCLFKDQPPTDLPAQAIITMDDLSDIGAAILRAYKAGCGGRKELSIQQFDTICRALAPEFRVYEPLRVSLDTTAEALARLTRQQLQVLRGFDANPRAIIEGVAGSGKTLLAMQRARSFAVQYGRPPQGYCSLPSRRGSPGVRVDWAAPDPLGN